MNFDSSGFLQISRFEVIELSPRTHRTIGNPVGELVYSGATSFKIFRSVCAFLFADGSLPFYNPVILLGSRNFTPEAQEIGTWLLDELFEGLLEYKGRLFTKVVTSPAEDILVEWDQIGHVINCCQFFRFIVVIRHFFWLKHSKTKRRKS